MLDKLKESTLLKYMLVGAVNTCVGYGVMFIFYNFLKCSYWVSSALNYIFGTLCSFTLNRRFTFKSDLPVKKVIFVYIGTVAVAYVLAYSLAPIIINSLLSGYDLVIRDNISLILGMFLYTCINYLMQKHFVFKKRT